MVNHYALHALGAVYGNFYEIGSVGNVQVGVEGVHTSFNSTLERHNALAEDVHHVDAGETSSACAELKANRTGGWVWRYGQCLDIYFR